MASLIFSSLLCTLLATLCLLRRYWHTPGQLEKPRACRKIGVGQQEPRSMWRNIGFALLQAKRRRNQGRQGPSNAVVESLYLYPIKSCRAVQVEEAEVLSTGFKYDRQYTFAEFRGTPQGESVSAGSESTGWHSVTQRKYGKLANIQLEVWEPDPESLDYAPGEPNVLSDGVLVVRYPDPDNSNHRSKAEKSFELPYNPTKGQISNQGYSMQKMTIWKDCPDSLLITSTDRADAPPWIRDIQASIGCSKPFALFRVATGNDRQVFRNAPRKQQIGYQSVVGFADAYPFHILGLASVADLDHRLKGVTPAFTSSIALRFRANIYFKGPTAYAEDSWKRIRIGQQTFHVACRTTRCELPNTDQLTGKKHLSEPSKTMRSYRDIDEGAGPGRACLGMQMVPAAEKGIVRVGDEIEILETGEHRYILQ
ncbi:MAG: hypothetical protein LQ338_004077 [Usnochroma carphineum]|nr:MAG: hypothetical protein LQ338_004077 [Usnochroma carphineum]